jgi:flagellar biosynthetic protein FliO
MKYNFDLKQLDPKKKKAILWISVALVLVTIFSIALLSWKIKSHTPDQGSSFQTQSPTGIIMNVIMSLVFVFGLIYFLFYIVRWFQSKKSFVSTKKLTISETIRLSPHQQIHIIKVGNRKFLLGATEQSINLITELEQEEETQVNPSEQDPEPVDFKTVLQQNVKNFIGFPKQSEKDN